ncbi:germ cell-less protein-like 1 [Trichechus manatus latirostris]|uniref:Germ cell-less protein-like 1 n=1 Tax=Trichechus manatus latirostris TaxID=127582 RepID=A0A2Y9R770_TRIMA|nr:germ cell-less protein-like 1 [Trichechus manatus latirostris]
MGSLSSRVLRHRGRTQVQPEPGSGAVGSARGPRTGGDTPGHGFCYCPGSLKRKRSSGAFCYCHPDSETDEDEEEGDEQQRLLNTPRRKKLKSTSKYIYQTLFLNGENSDIKICALGEEWSLHKIYLCQSGYFSSMFSGSWKESSMNTIELEIPDQNIDIEALQVAFGSLYRDDVLIKPSRVIAILAAACMLQLDGLIQQCGETMKETINVKTVCGYYTAAGTYGLDSVKKKCLEWLLNNLMTHQNVELFKELRYYKYYTVFKELSTEWLSSVYKQQWLAMLRAEQDSEVGPQEINKEELEGHSMRCGRKLAKDGEYCWRWTGFNFGFDLLVTYTNRYIIFKRNTLNQPCSGSVSLQPRRSIAFRLRLASFDSNGKLICSRTTGYQILTLEKDQEQVVMNLDSRLLIFPLYICCNFLYISPEKRIENNRHPENPEN